MGSMTESELSRLLKRTRIQERGRNIAYDVLVAGMDVSSAAKNHQVSEQWVLNLCNRIKDLKNNSNSIKISVTLPASIAPQAKQMLLGLKEVYELGQTAASEDSE
ncbi:Uncharacterised protein [Moraxella ovis]|uniref:Uncharacterized protein n=2 Tax=Moraxella ovis TaxID=29433 RepID=A0A378QDE7_9GAMM|nr:Uncharacterised protein [Moraxella ovis]